MDNKIIIRVGINVCQVCKKFLNKCDITITFLDGQQIIRKCCGQCDCKSPCTKKLEEFSHGSCLECRAKEEVKNKRWIRKRLLVFLNNLLIKKEEQKCADFVNITPKYK